MARYALAAALVFLLGTGCSAWRPAHSGTESPFRITVRNATGEDSRIEYCAPVGGCSQLGQLSHGAAATYTLPRAAGSAKHRNRIVVIGYLALPRGVRQQIALAPVHLEEGRSATVTLLRKGSSQGGVTDASRR